MTKPAAGCAEAETMTDGGRRPVPCNDIRARRVAYRIWALNDRSSLFHPKPCWASRDLQPSHSTFSRNTQLNSHRASPAHSCAVHSLARAIDHGWAAPVHSLILSGQVRASHGDYQARSRGRSYPDKHARTAHRDIARTSPPSFARPCSSHKRDTAHTVAIRAIVSHPSTLMFLQMSMNTPSS